MQPLVDRAAEHRLDPGPVGFGVVEGEVILVCLATLPDCDDRIQGPNEGAREGMATIAQWATRKKPAFLFVNNRLEGNAPETIEAVIPDYATGN
jgi:hypothetical protein